jgi:hypothetical protein
MQDLIKRSQKDFQKKLNEHLLKIFQKIFGLNIFDCWFTRTLMDF